MTANSKRNRSNGAGGDRDTQVAAEAIAAEDTRRAVALIEGLAEPVMGPRLAVAASLPVVFPPERAGTIIGLVPTDRGAEDRSDDPELSRAACPPTEPVSAEKESIQIHGSVDGLDSERRLAGWAWTAAAQPHDPVIVHVYENDVLISQGLADRYRSDVKAAGYGNGNAGFLLPLPDLVFDGAIHRFDVRMMSAGGRLARTLDIFLPRMRVRNSQLRARESGREPNSELYVPGHLVTYTAGMRPPAYHTQGWGQIDEFGTWMQGTDAVLEFIIRRPIDSYVLEIDIFPGPFNGSPPALELYFNYMRIGFASVPVSRLITCRLPSELFVMRKSIIGFHCRNAIESMNGSSRVLALRQWIIY